jgi:integrase
MAVVQFPIPVAVEQDGPDSAVSNPASEAKPRNVMHRISITDKEARRLPLGSGAHLDRELKGFMVICNAASRSYVLQRDFQGRARRFLLGRVGEITADRARMLALEYLETMRQGKDPAAEQRAAQVRGMTLKEAFRLFIGSGNLAPKTVNLYQDAYDRYLSPWANRTMEEIGLDRTGVHDLHRQIQRTVEAKYQANGRTAEDDEEATRRHPPGWARANGTMRLLAAIYSRARRQIPTLPLNPAAGERSGGNVDLFEGRSRDTSLSTEELKEWYQKVLALPNPVKQVYWFSVLLTGGRRNQVAEARWEHLDLDRATWFFPKPKGGSLRKYTVPVSAWLVEQLKTLKQQNEQLYPDSPWVFPASRIKDDHIQRPRNDRQDLPFAHALRHTYRTHALIAGVTDLECHLLMNHRVPGVNAQYITRAVTFEHLRVAQERITAHFLKCFGQIRKKRKL